MKRIITYILAAFFTLVTLTANAQDYLNRDYFLDGIVAQGYEIINVENHGVKGFIDDRSYDLPELVRNYSFSIVKKYSKGYPSKPSGIMLRWNSSTPVEEISSLVVSVVESEVARDESILESGKVRAKRYYPSANSKEYLLCNMCPQMYCYYKVEEVLNSGERKIVKTGKFYTEGQVRMLRVDGMANVRDFGGWPTIFYRPVLYGRIFRGNRPEVITATGRNDFVKNERITADLDLRGSNLSKSPLGPLSEVEYYCTNNQRYKLALTSGTAALAKDLNIIAKVLRKGGNVFLHCNHGMNRAGTLSFLIEGILGLDEADLTRDYELSSFAYGSSRSNTYGDMLPYIRSYGSRSDDLAQCFYNYARSIGVTEETLDIIRSEMLGIPLDDPLILDAHRKKNN